VIASHRSTRGMIELKCRLQPCFQVKGYSMAQENKLNVWLTQEGNPAERKERHHSEEKRGFKGGGGSSEDGGGKRRKRTCRR